MSQSIDSVLMGTPSRGSEADGASGDEEVEEDKFVRQLFESLLIGTKASNAIPDAGGQEVRRVSSGGRQTKTTSGVFTRGRGKSNSIFFLFFNYKINSTPQNVIKLSIFHLGIYHEYIKKLSVGLKKGNNFHLWVDI